MLGKSHNWMNTEASAQSVTQLVAIAAKYYLKLDLKVFCTCSILLDFFNLSH